MQPARPPQIVRFESFEVDLRARELRKDGVSTGLAEQSIKILPTLLARPNEVVLREEIRKKLWPNDIRTVGAFSLDFILPPVWVRLQWGGKSVPVQRLSAMPSLTGQTAFGIA